MIKRMIQKIKDGTALQILQELCASASTRSLFSYVPQDNTLFSGTIAENLRITNPNATNDVLRDALRMACADEFVSAPI